MAATTETTSPPLLQVEGLKVHYPVKRNLLGKATEWVRAVDGVSFTVERGKTVGLVGESGSGKTTVGRAILKLAPVTAGTITYDGAAISAMTGGQFFPYRKRIQMVFQDPYNSLNPRMSIAQILAEPLDIHFPQMDRTQKRDRSAALLERVNLPADALDRYPHEFSGGQRQRIGIARALAVEPESLVCDEPVSALDVSVQAQIVNLLQDLQRDLGLTYLFVAHDLAVVEHISDEILVMTNGQIVERGEASALVANPQHEYTQKLLEAVPAL